MRRLSDTARRASRSIERERRRRRAAMLHREADRIAERIKLGQGQPVTLRDLSPLAPESRPLSLWGRAKREFDRVESLAGDFAWKAVVGLAGIFAVLAVLAWL